MHTIEGKLLARGRSFGIVVSRFNGLVTDQLLQGAVDCLVRHGAEGDAISVVRCPGSFEIPQVAMRLAGGEKFDAVICLGAVIRGATPHFDYVANEVSKGIASAGLDSGVPITFVVLTTDTLEQAIERAGTMAGNKGFEAAVTAIETANLLKRLK